MDGFKSGYGLYQALIGLAAIIANVVDWNMGKVVVGGLFFLKLLTAAALIVVPLIYRKPIKSSFFYFEIFVLAAVHIIFTAVT